MLRKNSASILTFLLILTGFFLWQATQIKSSYSLSDFFPQDDPDTEFFVQYKQIFSLNTEYVWVGFTPQNGIFDPHFLESLEEASSKLKQIPFVQSVQSPTALSYQIKDPLFGLIHSEPYIHINQPETYTADSLRILQDTLLLGNFFSEDLKSLSLLIEHKSGLSKKEKTQLLRDIKDQFESSQVHGAKLGGFLVAQNYLLGLIKHEMFLFILLSVLLIVLCLGVAFRSLWGMVLPLLIVVLALAWLLGIMVLADAELGILSNILPSILLVVGISASIHILSRYKEELRIQDSKQTAIIAAIKGVGTANLLTSSTTALGFLTLLTCSVGPVRDLGLFTAIGVMIALLLSCTLLPSLIILSNKRPKEQAKDKSELLESLFIQMFMWVMKNQKAIVISSMLLLGIGIIGIQKLEMNSYLLEGLRGEHKLEEDQEFFEKNFSGLRGLELSVSLKSQERSFEEASIYAQLILLENYLVQEYGLTHILSPLTFQRKFESLKLIPKHVGILNYRDHESKVLQRILLKADYGKWASADNRRLRFSGRMADVGTKVINRRNEHFNAFLSQNCPDLAITQTGIPVLLDKNNQEMTSNLLQGLLIAILAVAILTGCLFQSFRMVSIALFSNCFPLIVIAGLMGFMQIELKLSSAIIFSIAFGIAVDDTLHFLCRLREEMKVRNNLLKALRISFLSTGKAIVLTSIVLMGGFLSLSISSVYGTFYLGLFTCLILLLAVLVDLFLLPVLLVLFFAPKTASVKKSATLSYLTKRFSNVS